MTAREDVAAYMKQWRETPSGKASLEAQKRRDKAKRAAIKKLITRHKSEFEHLLRQEIQAQERAGFDT